MRNDGAQREPPLDYAVRRAKIRSRARAAAQQAHRFGREIGQRGSHFARLSGEGHLRWLLPRLGRVAGVRYHISSGDSFEAALHNHLAG